MVIDMKRGINKIPLLYNRFHKGIFMLIYYNYDIVMQEIPTEVMLSFSILGCPNNCNGCHWDKINHRLDKGKKLDMNELRIILNKYSNSISGVLFFGGEWDTKYLIELIEFIKKEYSSLKIALYSGKDLKELDINLLEKLDYIKYGPYIKELGNLKSNITNQRLLNLNTKEDITYMFWTDIIGVNKEYE